MRSLPPLLLLASLGFGCASSPTTSGPRLVADTARPSGRDLVATDRPPAPERGTVEPVILASLADLPVLVVPDRADRGGVERIESQLSEEEIAELVAAAMSLPPSSRIDVARSDGFGGTNLEPGVSFDSIEVTECCNGGTLNPPDPELAVGPGHVIAVVNAAVEIYDLDGTSVFGPTPLETLFAPLGVGCTAFAFDPNAVYDEDAERFIVGADGNGTEYCIAASQSSDPTAGWNLYAIPTNVGGQFFDYPHVGVGRDALYLGGNMFGAGFGRVWAIDKVAMYAGTATSFVTHSAGSDFTPQPLNLHGAAQGTWPTSGPHYVATSRSFPSTFGIYSWADPFGADAFMDLGSIDVALVHGVTVGFPVPSLQQGGGSVTSFDPRIQDFDFRDGFGWLANSVSCNPGGGSVNCVQWAQIDLASVAAVQAGVFGSDGEYRIFGDVATDACGNTAIGYSKTTAASFPGIFVAAREALDPIGTMQAELELKAGEVTYLEPGRWGDYSEMTISPDGSTFWYLGEYSKDTTTTRNWGTFIGSFRFPRCGALFVNGFEEGSTSGWSFATP